MPEPRNDPEPDPEDLTPEEQANDPAQRFDEADPEDQAGA